MGVRQKENLKLSGLHHHLTWPHFVVLQRTQSPANARRHTKIASAKL